MSRDSSFEGHLSATSPLTEEQAAVFSEMAASNELQHAFHVDATNGSLEALNSDNTSWVGYHPRGYNWSEHKNRRYELGMNMEFDAFLVHLLSQPEFAGVEFTGTFTIVTDGDTFPTIRRLTIADGQVRLATATISFDEGEVVPASYVASL